MPLSIIVPYLDPDAPNRNASRRGRKPMAGRRQAASSKSPACSRSSRTAGISQHRLADRRRALRRRAFTTHPDKAAVQRLQSVLGIRLRAAQRRHLWSGRDRRHFRARDAIRRGARGMKQNRPPSDGLQFYGHGKIDGATGQMTVTLRDRADVALWSTTLDPKMRRIQSLVARAPAASAVAAAAQKWSPAIASSGKSPGTRELAPGCLRRRLDGAGWAGIVPIPP